MKRLLFFFLTVIIAATLVSCEPKRDASELVLQFLDSYGAAGVVYSSFESDGCEPLSDELFKKIYIYDGEMPENCAVFLNSFADYGSECGVFICEDAQELRAVEKCCLERIALLGRGGDNAFVMRSGSTVFYSTMSDAERAREIWREVIR